MTVYTGIATDYDDLLTELRDALVLEGWTVNKEETIVSDRYIYFKGPDITVGLGTINVYINIRRFRTTNFILTGSLDPQREQAYNWEIRGATGYAGGSSFNTQPNVNPKTGTAVPTLTLSAITTQYWFVISNRRFIVIAKTASVYPSLYAGLILPYATPSEYSYPLYISTSASDTEMQYTNTTTGANTQGIAARTSGIGRPVEGASYLLNPNNTWFKPTLSAQNRPDNMWPVVNGSLGVNIQALSPDGNYTLTPITLFTSTLGGVIWGELDGVYFTQGENNASENTLTISAEPYACFQNHWQITRVNFFAIKMV